MPAYRKASLRKYIKLNMNELQLNDGNNDDQFICGVVEGFYGKPWNCDQRIDLFKRLKELRMNAFMYAPKDDTKHRSKWRQLYSESEANNLKTLIDEAKANGVNFYYSLAPGLDMVYSDTNEVNLLIRKYDQLVALGCESFAILFDDIEPILNEKDREKFKTYAAAQVSISNMIFEHLKQPKFLFCPTEYCESRAVPDVAKSVYLNTLGTGLHKGIDFMWSGSRVISRTITEESIEELTKVIRRRPVIWENLHANDYDKKRIFLGPYSGRSTKIIPKLKGVLTNPNCEYEANYIAIHTLAQWSKCTDDCNSHNRCNRKEKPDLLNDENLTEDTLQEKSILGRINGSVYDPDKALVLAIRDWLPYILQKRLIPTDTVMSKQLRVDLLGEDNNQSEGYRDNTNTISTSTTTNNEQEGKEIDVEENSDEMVPDVESSAASNKSDMDTSGSPVPQTLVETNSCDSFDMQDANASSNTNCDPMKGVSDTQVTSVNDQSINFDNLSLLVDLFYLPFEHGLQGSELLQDIKWLKDNSDIFITENLREQCSDTQQKQPPSPPPSEIETSELNQRRGSWILRAEKLISSCRCIINLANALIYFCPNKLLLLELYPYLIDMRNLAWLIIDYARSLRYRTCTPHCFYHQYSYKIEPKEAIAISPSDEQEPWARRGGFVGDVQRLIDR